MYVFSYKLNLIILQPFKKLTNSIVQPDNHQFVILYIYKLLKRLGRTFENLHLGIPKKILCRISNVPEDRFYFKFKTHSAVASQKEGWGAKYFESFMFLKFSLLKATLIF